MTIDEFLSLNVAAREAVLDAILVRNGLEDLHVAGAFSDEQAPKLNRAVRSALYEIHISATRDGQGYLDYLLEVADAGHEEAGDDLRDLCRTGAAGNAVRDFALEEGIPEQLYTEMVVEAQLALLCWEEHELLRTADGIVFALSYATHWEPPELSPSYCARFLT